MNRNQKRIIKKFLEFPLLDILFIPFVLFSGIIFLIIRMIGLRRLKLTRKILKKIGVMPVRDHYYEPFFNEKKMRRPLTEIRNLPGIDWNTDGQLKILEKFDYNNELSGLPFDYVDELTFHFKNETFGAGDAEYLYNMIRLFKPNKIIEIGSGNSTKIACLAIKKNKQEDKVYNCEHICIEPFERPWLEELNVLVMREKVENIDVSLFKSLNKNDILFIDSSHIIKPQGDVLFEYLEILPILKTGVIVHVHDIFSPRDYPEEWIIKDLKLWNEQYLLESFLTSNKNWKVIGALNYLQHSHHNKLKEKCLNLTQDREPGSFYILKVR